MKTLDLMKIALKSLNGRWMALPVAGFAVSAFCLCFAGTIFTTVRQEKSLPCELAVSSQGNTVFTAREIAVLTGINGVTAATPLLLSPVTVKSGDYSAQLTLAGLDASYLSGEFLKGTVFPGTTVMPYIVLNEAACKQFSNGQQEASGQAPALDWLKAGFTVQMGEGARRVVSRVCGVLSGGAEQEPAAWCSLSSAKELMNNSGQDAVLSSARVRVANIGYAGSVSRAIAALGFTVGNPVEALQLEWTVKMNEMGYLIVTGAFSLLCSLVLLSAWRKISLLEQRDAWSMLQWMGMQIRDIGSLFILQSIAISLFGIAIGIIASVCLPSFLAKELQGTSVFTLPIPAGIAVLSAAVCEIIGVLSVSNNRIKPPSPASPSASPGR